MAVQEPFPDMGSIVRLIGEAGNHLADIGASEGAAGNISVVLRWPVPELPDFFPREEPIELPLEGEAAPELAGATLVVTGSGRRLREVHRDPGENLAAIQVGTDGRTARLFASRRRLFQRPTSELVSHLAIHRREILRTDTNFHAVVHAQPLYITYLSHLPRYQDTAELNRRILRWQPETLHNVPEGIAYTPFRIPGTAELMAATLEAMEKHRVVLWAKHGVISRSDVSVKRAVDLIEYLEVAARYEYLNLTNGDAAGGLTIDEIHRFCEAHNIRQSFY